MLCERALHDNLGSTQFREKWHNCLLIRCLKFGAVLWSKCLTYCPLPRCLKLSETEYKEDAIIIAGDISDDLQVIKDTLKLFLSKWAHVFFVPGNHELWMRRSDAHLRDSLREFLESLVIFNLDPPPF